MQANLLIVDSIATNRVALKVKLAAAWYDVNTVATGEEALSRVADLMPNLILVNNQLPDMHVAELSARLKAKFDQAAPPILALSEVESVREALLRSGVEDVLPMPVDDGLLIARIRSVLRSVASEAEWRLRDGTTRALGFAEPKQSFERPVSVIYLHNPDPRKTQGGQAPLPSGAGLAIRPVPFSSALRDIETTASGTVLVINLPEEHPDRALAVLSDLRANMQTRHKAILVCVPEDRADLAARALDLGADEVTLGTLPSSELALRARRLHKRREMNDSLRAMVKNGAEAAIRDPLTGLYNRRYALPHLDRVAEQARVSGRPYAVMIADLDHFKQINDWHGHEAGDAVLVECARRMQRNLRAVDLVARIGGEEFLLVLPAAGRAEARHAALRLCKRISEAPFQLPGSDQKIEATISVGLALSDQASPLSLSSTTGLCTPQQLLARADRALYSAKQNGRNRFMLEQSAAA